MSAEPAWALEARKHLGLRETPGTLSTPELEAMWRSLPGGAWYWEHFGGDDSKLPWCGAFLAIVMRACGFPIPARYASAIEWAEWGQKLSAPTLGCVGVLRRPGGAHVMIALGRNAAGQIVGIGGNQRDSVCILPFDEERVAAWRWPPKTALPALAVLPLLATTGPASRNEA